MTVVKTTGSRFLCYEPLIEMIRVQSLWHIIIGNRCMRQGLNHYPLCQRIPNKLVLRKDTDIIHVAMGGQKSFYTCWGGFKKFWRLAKGGVKKVWRQKFSTAQPPPPPPTKVFMNTPLVQGIVENFSTGLGESVGEGWNYSQTIIFHHSPHEQSIFVYCLPIIWVQIDSSTVLDSGSLKNTNYKLSCHNLNYNRLQVQ